MQICSMEVKVKVKVMNKMTGRKSKSILDVIKHVDLDVKIPDKTEAVPQINLISLLYIKTHDSKSMLIVSSRHFMCKKE